MEEIQHIALDRISPWPNDAVPDESNPAFKKTITIINNLPSDTGKVGIATREGLKFDVKSRSSMVSNVLTIRVDIFVDSEVRRSIMERMNTRDMENSEVLTLARNQWHAGVNHISGYGSDRIRVEYTIDVNLLKRHGGVIYVKDIDYVIALGGCEKILEHPYSRAGGILSVAQDVVDEIAVVDGKESYVGSANFIRTVKIIDNTGVIGRRWTKIGQEVFLIEPVRNSHVVDGIYVISSKPVGTEKEKSELSSDRYDPGQDIPYFKLHKSYLEALNDEVSAEVRKYELQMSEFATRRAEAESKAKRAELDLERAQTERDNLAATIESNKQRYEHETQVLEHRIEELALERDNAKLKEKFEKTSIKRKSFLELLKGIPVIITGGLTLILTIMRLMRRPA